jgi:hypothetical protein
VKSRFAIAISEGHFLFIFPQLFAVEKHSQIFQNKKNTTEKPFLRNSFKVQPKIEKQEQSKTKTEKKRKLFLVRVEPATKTDSK